MSYDLESNEETLGDKAGIGVMKDSASDVAMGGSGVGRGRGYPTVSVDQFRPIRRLAGTGCTECVASVQAQLMPACEINRLSLTITRAPR